LGGKVRGTGKRDLSQGKAGEEPPQDRMGTEDFGTPKENFIRGFFRGTKKKMGDEENNSQDKKLNDSETRSLENWVGRRGTNLKKKTQKSRRRPKRQKGTQN